MYTKSTLSINKYLEEFPGLVHFIYVDRITHRFVAPGLDFSSVETTSLTKKKVFCYFTLDVLYFKIFANENVYDEYTV